MVNVNLVDFCAGTRCTNYSNENMTKTFLETSQFKFNLIALNGNDYANLDSSIAKEMILHRK